MRILPFTAALAPFVAAPTTAQCFEQRLDPLTATGAYTGFGAALAAGEGRLLAGAHALGIGGRVEAFHAAPEGHVHDATLEPSAVKADDGFGFAVDLDGDIAVIGSPGHDPGGAAYVFELVGGTWTEIAKVLPPSGWGGAFGSAVAADGGRLAVGAPGEAGGGLVHVFRRSVGGWVHEAALAGSGLVTYSDFGQAVALEGSVLVVGDPTREVDGHAWGGETYVFEHTSAGWAEVARLDAGAAAPRGGFFGRAVAIRDGRVAIGEPFDTDPISEAEPGRAHVFERQVAGWVRVAEFQGSLPPVELLWGDVDRFGGALAWTTEGLLVGASATKAKGNWSGATYLFQPGASGWIERAHIVVPGTAPGGGHGHAVAVDGDSLFTGGPWEDGAGGGFVGSVWHLDATVGGARRYCVAAPNSAGAGALIDHRGTLSLLGDDFRLRVTGAPPGEVAQFLYGADATEVPFGSGVLCVAGPWYRLPPGQINGNGRISVTVDLSAPPAGSGPGGLVAGSTWCFQLWYRDGATTNASDGLRVSFCR